MTALYVIVGVIFGLDVLIVLVLWTYTKNSRREERRASRRED